MIKGVGIDIHAVDRMRRALADDPGFAASVFTSNETERCVAAPDPARAYAAVFAAKEAVVKAVGGAGGIPENGGSGTFWLDIAVGDDVALTGRLKDIADAADVTRVLATRSYTDDHALAWAVAVGPDTGDER